MAEDDGKSRKDIWVTRAKAWGTVVAAVGGLVTAVGAALKPRDDSATKAAYGELAKGQAELSGEVQALAVDLSALRGWAAGTKGAALPASRSSESLSEPAGAKAPEKRAGTPLQSGGGPPKAKLTPPSVIRLGEISVNSSLEPTPPTAYAPSLGAVAPPEVHGLPAPVKPAAFDEVLRSAK